MRSRRNIVVPFRRKKQGRTDYKNRLTLLKGKTLRLVVRRANKNFIAQIVKYSPQGDIVLSTAHTTELVKYGYNISRSNYPAAYLIGYLLAKKSNEKKAILDLGLQTPIARSKLYAVVKGCVDGGLVVPVDEEVLPAEDRINGKHIADYLAGTAGSEKQEFSLYRKNNVDADRIKKLFEDTKQKIDESVNKK
ncbi:MAG: 50S ribosomal protein L18 [Nanoarchaeota archaeon]|nr:50S ribosomal protein L18 [Nanoarchaeota archaeon]